MKRTKPDLKIIGLSDYLDIPKARLSKIACKVDTGAYNCSIHCSEWSIRKVNGELVLFYVLLDTKHTQFKKTELQTTDFVQKKVKSSNGVIDYRYQVTLEIHIQGETHAAKFNLSKRHNMKYPILLGRRFLSNKFLVDVSLRQPTHR